MPRLCTVVPATLLLALLTACQSTDPVRVELPKDSNAIPRVTYALNAGEESIVGLFHVEVDLETLTAQTTPVRQATAQPPQAIYYDLDIYQFLDFDAFRIDRIEVGEGGRVSLMYSHLHPFNAPAFAAPITGLNRADLGYTGRTLVFAEENTHAFFGGEVTLNPSKLLNPDGYVEPGDLLAGGHLNSAFPYKLLADEQLDNRTGLSNGGNPQGNYDPLAGGWQRSNAGPDGNAWMGYDYVHQGQEVRNTLVLQAGAGSPNLNFYVALLIKYTDPRGQGGRNLRFPPEIADVTQFAYRLPFAALDASKVEAASIDFGDFVGSARTMHLLVRDWDTFAAEGTDANLSDETDVSRVQPGAPGEPVVTIDMPDVSATPFASTGTAGTGLPGDELDYAIDVFNTLNPGPGDYFACARAVDPEDALDRSAYHFGVDPYTILPTRTPISLVTYQVIPYTIGGSIPEVLTASPTGDFGLPGTQVTFTATHTGTALRWNFGAGAVPRTSTDPSPTVILEEAGTHFGTVIATTLRGDSDPFVFEYTVATPTLPSFVEHSLLADDPYDPAIVFKNDRPALFWTGGTDDATVHFARAQVSLPASAADWAFSDTTASTDLDFNYGALLDVAVQQDRFVVATNNGEVSIATVAEPSSISDWNTHAYDNVVDGYYAPTLVALSDRLMIASFHRGVDGGNEKDARISHSNVPLPANAGSWVTSVPFEFGDSTGTVLAPHALVPYGTGVAWAYVWRTSGGIDVQVRRSLITGPLSGSDWTNTGFYDTGPTLSVKGVELGVLNGRLQLLFQRGIELAYASATTADPQSETDWVSHELPGELSYQPDDVHMEFLDGRPIVLVCEQPPDGSGSLAIYHLYRGLTGQIDSTSDWGTHLFHSSLNPTMSFPTPIGGLAVHNGRFHIAFIDRETNELSYDTSTGTW